MSQAIFFFLLSILMIMLEPGWALIFAIISGFLPPLFFIFVTILNQYVEDKRIIVFIVWICGLLFDATYGYLFGLTGLLSLFSLITGQLVVLLPSREGRYTKILTILVTLGIFVTLRYLLFNYIIKE